MRYRHHILCVNIVIDSYNCIQAVTVAGRCKQDPAIVNKAEFNFFICKRNLRNKVDNHSAFRTVTLHKLQPGRRIEKQICYDKCRSVRAAGLLISHRYPAAQENAGTGFGVRCFGDKLTACNGCNGCERFSSEAQSFYSI